MNERKEARMEGKERNSGKQAARSARKEKGREWKKRRK